MANAIEKKLVARSMADTGNNGRQLIYKRTSAAAMMESVFACKWSARILNLIGHGVNRPGAITGAMSGLSTKVMNDCLRRLIDFKLLERMSYPEIPPRVEYKLTDFGVRFVEILDKVEELQSGIDREDKSTV